MEEDTKDTKGQRNLEVSGIYLLVGCPMSQLAYLRDGSAHAAQTIVRAATLRQVADQTFYLTQSQYPDTGATSPSAYPITPGAWQGSHWSAKC